MKSLAAVLAVMCFLWIASGVIVAVHTYQARTTNQDRLCTLHKTLVTFIDDSLAGVTPKEAAAQPVAYQRGYSLDAQLVKTLVDEAPCDFAYHIPPNLLGRPKGHP